MKKKYTRRQLMVAGTGLGAALIGVMLSIPALGFLLSPLFIQKRTYWVTVGPIDHIPVATPTPLYADLPSEAGWPVPTTQRVVYVVKHADGSFLALSNICTHLQCDVHWSAGLGEFICPCHGGMYDMDGNNIGGPPPQPLAQWTHRVRYDAATNEHLLEIQNTLEENI